MLVLNDVLGYKNRKIYQNDNYFKFSLDGVLLANFVNIKLSTKKIIDIGTGTGIIPLILSLKTNLKIDALEIEKKLVDIFNKTIIYNKLEENINLINGDIKEYANDNLNKYDIVVCNPPYFSVLEEDSIKNNAKHEKNLYLEEMVNSSKKILKDKGSLYLVYTSSKLGELISLLELNNFSIKTLKFVHNKKNQNSKIVLVEAIKNGNTLTNVLSPFILFEKDDIMTEEYYNIYHGKSDKL